MRIAYKPEQEYADKHRNGKDNSAVATQIIAKILNIHQRFSNMRKFIHFTPMHKLAVLQKSAKNVLKMNILCKNGLCRLLSALHLPQRQAN